MKLMTLILTIKNFPGRKIREEIKVPKSGEWESNKCFWP